MSLPVRIRLDPGVRTMLSFEKGELAAAGVGGERLVSVAVSDLEGVQGRAGVRRFAADDDPDARAGRGPAGEVDHLGDLDDVSVLTQIPIGVGRCGPGPLRDLRDGVPDRVGDGVAD